VKCTCVLISINIYRMLIKNWRWWLRIETFRHPSPSSSRIRYHISAQEDSSARIRWLKMWKLRQRPGRSGFLDWRAEDCKESTEGVSGEEEISVLSELKVEVSKDTTMAHGLQSAVSACFDTWHIFWQRIRRGLPYFIRTSEISSSEIWKLKIHLDLQIRSSNDNGDSDTMSVSTNPNYRTSWITVPPHPCRWIVRVRRRSGTVFIPTSKARMCQCRRRLSRVMRYYHCSRKPWRFQ